MTEESKFWQLIKKYLPGDATRIENTSDDGVPDVSAAYEGSDYWVELKVCENKKKYRDVVDLLRNSQYVWHYHRAKHGSKIFVTVKYTEMKRILLYILRNGRYEIIANSPFTKGYNWKEIIHALIINLRK